MKDFSRALRDALRYWHMLALSLLCSAGVACLWGANVAALFPIIEVTLHGKSLSEWNREQGRQAEINIAAYDQQLAPLLAQRDEPGTDQHKLRDEIEVLQTRQSFERAHAESAARLQPFFDKWLPGDPYGTVLLVVAGVMIGHFIKHFFLVSNMVLVGYVSTRVSRDIRTRLFDKAMELDRPTYMNIGTGGFASQITHASDMLSAGILNFYGGAVTEPLKIVACLTGAWVISWRLTICSLLITPAVVFMIIWLNRRIKRVARVSLDRSFGFHHLILECLNNLLTVQAFTMEPFERQRFRTSTNAVLKNSLLSVFYNSLTGPVTEVFGVGMVCIAIAAGSYLVIHQETHLLGVQILNQPLSAAGLMVFFGMLISASDPVRKLSGVMTAINNGSVAAKALYHMLDMPSKIETPPLPKAVPTPHTTLSLENVSFSYDGRDTVLNNVSLTIPFGRRVAFVGPNGGGKSTLVSLLCRFYDPTAGQITLDGVSLREMDLRDLRSRIALVTQHTEMFNETILFNIRYGRWDATDEEVFEAARKAHAHEFITGFPEGYQTFVGPNGQRLSGGQRQRIALARAILRDAEIFILDEATSQIDVASEELIHAALAQFGRNRTMLMITHRASTLSLADEIIQVERGTLTPVPRPALLAA
jgi:ATP-binding cassette subfamily B protein/subfamily B ATP-binding cassette protein MsbA